jgi:hypothetical protein
MNVTNERRSGTFISCQKISERRPTQFRLSSDHIPIRKADNARKGAWQNAQSSAKPENRDPDKPLPLRLHAHFNLEDGKKRIESLDIRSFPGSLDGEVV